MAPIDAVLGALLEFGNTPRQQSDGWACQCPSHEDRKPSLSISVGDDGRVLLKCHAGCDVGRICSALGLKMRDLFPSGSNGVVSNRQATRKSGVVAPRVLGKSKRPRSAKVPPFTELKQAIGDAERTRGNHHHRWDYHDAAGGLVGVVLRWNTVDPETGKRSKDYLPISFENETWAQRGMPTLRPLYRLPALLAATKDEIVWVGEGEKVADALRGLGLVATTSPHGSSSARQADWSVVRGRDVVIVCDRDSAGELYGAAVEELAREAGARSIRVLKPWVLWPDIPDKGDIADVVEKALESRENIRSRLLNWVATTDGQAPDHGFQPISAAELVRSFRTLREPVIEGLMREGEVMNLVAAPKVGKTWLAHALTLSVAAGIPWLGLKTTSGKVLLIDGELHPETLAERLQRTLKELGLSQTVLDNVEVWCLRGKRKSVDDFERALLHYPPRSFGLIVVDALYRFIPEGAEENSNESMTRIYNTLDAIAERARSGLAAVHHSTKGDQSFKSVTDIGAGGGAQSRAADVHLTLRPHEEEGAIVVEAAVRSWPLLRPFGLRWSNPGWVRDDTLDPTALARGQRARSKGGPSRKMAEMTTAEFVRTFVGPDPQIKEIVLNRAREGGIREHRATTLLKCAVSEGLVVKHAGGPSQPHTFRSASKPRG